MSDSPVSMPPVRLQRTIQCLAFAWFFCLLAVNFVLRPIRETIGVAGNDGDLARLYTGTFVAMLVANPIYGLVVTRFRREAFVPWVYLVFASNLVAFCVAFALLGKAGREAAYKVFFVWLSVFNLCAVTTFWGLLVDVLDRAAAKRTFGVIAAGGTLGAIAGSQAAQHGSSALGFVGLLAVATALLVLAALLARSVLRQAAPPRAAQQPLRGHPLQGWRDALGGAYLRSISTYLLLFTVATTFLYFARREVVQRTVAGTAERIAYHAQVDTWSNVLTLVAQLVGTAPLLQAVGIGRCLALVPVACMAGFAWLAASPTLAVVSVFEVVRRGAHFAVSKPAQEVLFTVVERSQKYKAKSFIDTVVYRGGDVFAAWCYTQTVAGFGGMATALLAAGLALGWTVLALALGRQHESVAHRKLAVASGH